MMSVSHAEPLNATDIVGAVDCEFPPGLFVIGTDTGVGKTFVGCQLARSLVASSIRVGVYKPVASGISPDEPSDPQRLHDAASLAYGLELVCPQVFRAPLAPPIAASAERRQVDERLLVSGASSWKGKCDFLIVEGAGGALSPISNQMTVLDLAVRLRYPLLLVVANRLGCVNHTLLTIEAAKLRGLSIDAIVINHRTAWADQSQPGNVEMIKRFAPGHCVVQSDDLDPLINKYLSTRDKVATS
jgi:dethiobiotin synthetase